MNKLIQAFRSAPIRINLSKVSTPLTYYSTKESSGKGGLKKPTTPVGRFDDPVETKEGKLEPQTPQPTEDDPYAPFPGGKNPVTGEIGGPRGPEPTRYGDWERKDTRLSWLEYLKNLKTALLPVELDQTISFSKECEGSPLNAINDFIFNFPSSVNVTGIRNQLELISSEGSAELSKTSSQNALRISLKINHRQSTPSVVKLTLKWRNEIRLRNQRGDKHSFDALIEQLYPNIEVIGNSFSIKPSTRFTASVVLPRHMSNIRATAVPISNGNEWKKYPVASRKKNATIFIVNYEMSDATKLADIQLKEFYIKMSVIFDMSGVLNYRKVTGYCKDLIDTPYYNFIWIIILFIGIYVFLNFFFSLDAVFITKEMYFFHWVMWGFKAIILIVNLLLLIANYNNAKIGACHALFGGITYPFLAYSFWAHVTPVFFLVVFGSTLFSIVGNQKLDLVEQAVFNLEAGKARTPKAQQATNYIKILISRIFCTCLFIGLAILNFKVFIVDADIVNFARACSVTFLSMFLSYFLRPLYIFDYKVFTHARSILGIFGGFFVGCIYRFMY
ncbi:DgyrCDS2193 [Dimorphilus gyrociliatus]|uniref:Succinate dehydrogenase assembly factor 4, mitochondrial n=1 Tax=Dimorphilus gyrociliatus TaxID=2664684 RepID=A0A7I8V9Q3_9ANNE|nr:DgyrCDS2193 [Dimorphilus gyrociliatus]